MAKTELTQRERPDDGATGPTIDGPVVDGVERKVFTNWKAVIDPSIPVDLPQSVVPLPALIELIEALAPPVERYLDDRTFHARPCSCLNGSGQPNADGDCSECGGILSWSPEKPAPATPCPDCG